MESIREYIRQVSLYLIFDSVIGIILPTGKYKKYISFVSGLILILIMVRPMKNILLSRCQINFLTQDQLQNLLPQDIYEKAYKNQIKKIGEDAGLKIKDIEIKLGAQQNLIRNIKIRLEQADQKSMNDFKNTLCLLYNLPDENVNLN